MSNTLSLLAIVTGLSLSNIAATPMRMPAPVDGGPPRVQLCGASSGEVSRKALLADPQVKLHGCVPTARVVAFSFTTAKGKGEKITHSTREAKFSEQMVKTITSLPDGSSFTIADLEVVDEKGVAYVVPSASFVLKA